MEKQNIIIVLPYLGEPDVYTNLKKACEVYGWKYNTIVRQKLPIEYKGFRIFRLKLK
jgi:hypothetical protein